MDITSDRYVAEFDGHTIELVRDNWTKTLEPYLDGDRVDSESRVLPYDITLKGSFQGQGGQTHQLIETQSIVNGPHIGRSHSASRLTTAARSTVRRSQSRW